MSLNFKKKGYILLQLATYLVLVGGIGDLILTVQEDPLPLAHLRYLKMDKLQVPAELKSLDAALIRAIGGLLIAIGLGSLVILYKQIRKGISSGLWAIILMISIGEGGNAVQMALINSPFFVYPLSCLVVGWLGTILWWLGDRQTLAS
jgi:hypothetical protein